MDTIIIETNHYGVLKILCADIPITGKLTYGKQLVSGIITGFVSSSSHIFAATADGRLRKISVDKITDKPSYINANEVIGNCTLNNFMLTTEVNLIDWNAVVETDIKGEGNKMATGKMIIH